MTLTTDNTKRFCSRCHLPLTDAASRECGVGPVCRKHDNHLFAKSIPANYAVAQALIMYIPEDGGNLLAPETVKVWAKARRSFMRIVAKVLSANQTGDTFHVPGGDLRKIVTAIDYMCSYEHPEWHIRSHLTKIVDALGYPGLAGVLSGEASTSKSKIWFESGRVFMSGLNNVSGWRAMGEIPGVERPMKRSRKTPYSAPAAQAEKFLNVVRRYWPLFEGDAENVLAAAKQWVVDHPTEARNHQAATTPVHLFEITIRSEDFRVTFPWIRGKNMIGLVSQFKASIPADQRSYDPASKTWSFRLNQLDTVRQIVVDSGIFASEHGTGIVEHQSNENTPPGLYKSAQERRAAAQANGRAQTWHSAANRFYGGWRGARAR
jgi:hypothetical protein